MRKLIYSIALMCCGGAIVFLVISVGLLRGVDDVVYKVRQSTIERRVNEIVLADSLDEGPATVGRFEYRNWASCLGFVVECTYFGSEIRMEIINGEARIYVTRVYNRRHLSKEDFNGALIDQCQIQNEVKPIDPEFLRRIRALVAVPGFLDFAVETEGARTDMPNMNGYMVVNDKSVQFGYLAHDLDYKLPNRFLVVGRMIENYVPESGWPPEVWPKGRPCMSTM